MSGGYFGKLPVRADFVNRECPAGFLRMWEPFLMEGLAQSRLDLSDGWEEAYMTMPVWWFWLEYETPGSSPSERLAGAFMPSIDKVGREFPLTVFRKVDEEWRERPVDEWYASVETILLKTLNDDATLTSFQDEIAGIAPPEVYDPAQEEETAGATVVLKAAKGMENPLRSWFRCRAGDKEYSFTCPGLPAAQEFLWFLVPESRPGFRERVGETGSQRGPHHSEDRQA